MRCGLKGAAKQRLVDVAEADVALGEIVDRLRIVPAGVANLDNTRIFDELAQQSFEILAIQSRVLKRNGKLNQQRAEFSGGAKRLKPFAGELFVFVIRTNGNRRCRLGSGKGGMRKRAMQLRGKKKSGISIGNDPCPELGDFGLDVSVERSIDFDHVEA